MKRVLYAGMRADYGDPRRGLSYEERNFHHALRHHPGLELRHFDFMELGGRHGLPGMTRLLKSAVESWRPDLLFMVPFHPDRDPCREAVGEITAATETATLAWMCDDHWRFEDYSSGWAGHLDWVVTTDPDAPARYAALGYGARVLLSQWAVNQRLYRPTYSGRDIPVSFVGQPHGDRPAVIEALRRAGIQVALFGHGWGPGTGRLPFQRMIEVFSRSRINLNLANASSGSPRQIKGRNFEVPGCGGFLLSEAVPHLERYFEPGREAALYRDVDELVRLVRHYLSEEQERAAVACRGYARCLREHTWDHRFQALFEAIGLWRGSAKNRAAAAGARA